MAKNKSKTKRAQSKYRPKVPDDTRRALLAEAGGKCANPGCPIHLTELHHIREWAVYQTHDLQHMIAVCPTCHSQVHRGDMRISDSELYAWKRQRKEAYGQLHTGLYVAPSIDRKLYLGFVGLTVTGQKTILRISATNTIAVEFRDDDLLVVDVVLTAGGGTRLVRLTNGIFSTTQVNDVTFRTRTGVVELTAPVTSRIIPRWLVRRLHTLQNHPYSHSMTLFRAMVLAPGRVLIEGIWAHHDRAIVAYADAIHWVSRTHDEPITLLPPSSGPMNYIAGDLAGSVFGFADEPAELAFKNLNPVAGPIPIDPVED